MTLGELLVRAAQSSHGVWFDDGFVRYSDILARARRSSARLITRGVLPGERVGIVLPTGVGFYDAFFGCILAGAVPVPLYPPMRLGRLDEYHTRTSAMLRSVDARLVVTDKRVLRVLGQTLEQAALPLGWIEVPELVEHSAETQIDVATSAMAFIQFSSGTTGAPKPIRLTHGQITANVDAILEAIVAAHPDVVHSCVSWLPLYHDMGLIGCVLAAMARPGDLTLLAPERFVVEPVRWLRAIADKRATISAAPNFAYALCTERIRDDELIGLDLSSWRVALNGAEPVAPRVLDRFVERFAPFGFAPEALTPVYGLAEATLAVSFSGLGTQPMTRTFDAEALAASGIARPGAGVTLTSVGRPLASVEVRVDAEADLGPILIRGPSVTSGYLHEPDRSADAWLDTGDTGFFADGELYVYGRAKDLVIIRGRKYAPSDIEQAITGVPGVRAGCVAAVGARGDDGEELVVFFETKGTVDTEAVRGAVTSATGLVPERLVALEAGTLPRTSSGKISRSEALRRYEMGALAPPKPVTPLRLAAATVRSRLALWRARP